MPCGLASICAINSKLRLALRKLCLQGLDVAHLAPQRIEQAAMLPVGEIAGQQRAQLVQAEARALPRHELRRTYTSDVRLVSRSPRKVNDTDHLVCADLLDARQTAEAVKGSRIVYFTAGLPPDTQLWEARFPDFEVTTYRAGLERIRREAPAKT